MDTDLFNCQLGIEPIYWDRRPKVCVYLDERTIWQGDLAQPLALDINERLSRGSHVLGIKFSGKQNSDCEGNKDQAVVIKSVGFFGVADDKFKWQAVYQPEYPEPWRSEQQAQGVVLPSQLRHKDYLGWNGTWRLEFSTPIFTWMHRMLDLGWIYS